MTDGPGSGDPFSDIRERVARFFEESPAGRQGEGFSHGTWSPSVDVCETPEEFIVKAEVPDVSPDDIHIKIESNMLILSGHRGAPRRGSENYHRLERSYGPFLRSFILPAPVMPDDALVTLKDGILKVVLPKAITRAESNGR